MRKEQNFQKYTHVEETWFNCSDHVIFAESMLKLRENNSRLEGKKQGSFNSILDKVEK